MTRIRRTFIATLVASAVTATTFGAAPTAMAAGCEWSAWKIKQRENVTCRKAKRVLKGEYGDADKVPGWNCSNTGNLIPEGKCKKGQTRSFKYVPK